MVFQNPLSQLSKNESKGGSLNPNPTIIDRNTNNLSYQRMKVKVALTIALPDAPSPLLPIKSTLGETHLRTLVLQSGADGAELELIINFHQQNL